MKNDNVAYLAKDNMNSIDVSVKDESKVNYVMVLLNFILKSLRYMLLLIKLVILI